jgi:hypothetical protein
MKNLEVWIKGFFAALISGLSSGFVSGVSLMGIDADHFNAGAGLKHVLAAAGTVGLFNAVMSVAFYLKKSPVPE